MDRPEPGEFNPVRSMAQPIPKLLPARYPKLRDIAIIVSILSTIVYFGTSEGVAGFVNFVLTTVGRFLRECWGWSLY
jgi:hypothetical protein